MKCAVDSNILIDIMEGDPRFGQWSAERLQAALRDHALVISPFVFCELLCGGKNAAQVEAFCQASRIEVIGEVPFEVYRLAAERFKLYLNRRRAALDVVECLRCGTSNRPTCSNCGTALPGRKLPMDDLIGAFAICSGDGRILTRDLGVFGHDFPDLYLV